MKSIAKERKLAKKRRHLRVRSKVTGTAERPRLCVYRSLKHIYASLINDTEGRTLMTVSSLSPDVKNAAGEAKGKAGLSATVGKVLAEKAKAQGIEQAAFDRGGYLYHGRVKAVAEGAREGGLQL